MAGDDNRLLRPTTRGIQKLAEPLLSKDEWGYYTTPEDAEALIDQILNVYGNVICRYVQHKVGGERLLVSSLNGRTKYLEVKIKP